MSKLSEHKEKIEAAKATAQASQAIYSTALAQLTSKEEALAATTHDTPVSEIVQLNNEIAACKIVADRAKARYNKDASVLGEAESVLQSFANWASQKDGICYDAKYTVMQAERRVQDAQDKLDKELLELEQHKQTLATLEQERLDMTGDPVDYSRFERTYAKI